MNETPETPMVERETTGDPASASSGGLHGQPPRIYYEGQGVTLWHGDARDVLRRMPADTVDLVVTDPPYGVNYRNARFGPIVGDTSDEIGREVLALAVRCLRNRRHIYAFGRWDWLGMPVGGTCELIWDKGVLGSGNNASPWGPQHETICFGVKGNAAQRADGGGRLAARLRRGSVLRHTRPSGVRVDRHPTEKPVGLLRELIEASSLFGETVLDPFAGSGSTLIAAIVEGRKAVGVEIEERYCEVAAKRLEAGIQRELALAV